MQNHVGMADLYLAEKTLSPRSALAACLCWLSIAQLVEPFGSCLKTESLNKLKETLLKISF